MLIPNRTRVNVYLTAHEYRRFVRLASRRHMSLSAWMRAVALEAAQ